MISRFRDEKLRSRLREDGSDGAQNGFCGAFQKRFVVGAPRGRVKEAIRHEVRLDPGLSGNSLTT
jgi:hypothetical protein